MVDINYWNDFYKKGDVPREGSTFASSILHKIDKMEVMVEMGCGNGRDAYFFASKGIKIWAFDIAETVTDLKPVENGNPKFICADFTNLQTPYDNQRFGTVYSRFTLHAIRVDGASRSLKWAFHNLISGGLLLIEVRSVLDPLCGKGTKVEGERDAWINTHYRRFLRKDELVGELQSLGFIMEHIQEENNLSIYKDDNPVVIRIHARKP